MYPGDEAVGKALGSLTRNQARMGGGISLAQPTPTAAGLIGRSSSLGNDVAQLSNMLDELTQKLQPLIRKPGADANVSTRPGPHPPSSALDAQFFECQMRVQHMCARILDLLTALDI